MKKDHPNYNPFSLTEGGRILEGLMKGHFTQQELKFAICVYRYSFGFQRRATPAKEIEEWRRILDMDKFAFSKTKKRLVDRKIVACVGNGKHLNMHFIRDISKWDSLAVRATTEKSPANTGSLVAESTPLPVESTPVGRMVNTYKEINKSIDKKELVDEAETATPSTSFSLSCETQSPKPEQENWPLFMQDDSEQAKNKNHRRTQIRSKSLSVREKEVRKRFLLTQAEKLKEKENANSGDPGTALPDDRR